MRWKYTALLGLLVLVIIAVVILYQPVTRQVVSQWPSQKVAGGVLLTGLIVWMWLYELHRSRHPQQRFFSGVVRNGKVIVKRSISGRLHRKEDL